MTHVRTTPRRAAVALALVTAAAMDVPAGCGGPSAPSSSSTQSGPSISYREDDAARLDQERLQGTWVLVALERDGKKLEPGIPEQVIFEGNTMTWKNPSSSFAKSFRLNPGGTPKQIDFTSISEET
jgi:hypothetical protein